MADHFLLCYAGNSQKAVGQRLYPRAWASCASLVEVGLLGKGAASPPNYDACCIVASTDALSQRLVIDQLRQET